MQAKARADLERLFAAELDKAGLKPGAITTYATPRRLSLIARDLPVETAAVSEETKGPRTSAPPQALDGFLRKTGLRQDQLEDRDGIWFAVVNKPGRKTADVLAEAIPAIVRAFPWPKSMRWGAASLSTESLRWVRPLQGIVALLGEEVVPFEIAGIESGAATLGHRFHHPGAITIGSAADYVEKLRACHVLVDQDERAAIIRDGAATLAAEAGLELIEDEGLVAENAGLTEWPVPLLGRFDEAFLAVPPEVIQLTARVNQKYFVCQNPPRNGEGDHREAMVEGAPPQANRLANAFICTANIAAADGGAKIIEGNRKVLAARLADAKFFYETDLKTPLETQAEKLGQIVFHEKLGTLADKVERAAKLARWLVEEGIVKSSPERGGGPPAEPVVEGPAAKPTEAPSASLRAPPPSAGADGPPPLAGEELAVLAERAARLAKADLVTGMVGEFPELQGVMGGYYAAAQGEDPRVAAAIRDHYKPIGQSDEVPTDPVTVAVSLADKLDTLVAFFLVEERPTGSKDPFALRRAAVGVLELLTSCGLRMPVSQTLRRAGDEAWWDACFAICKVEPEVIGRVKADLKAGVEVSFSFTNPQRVILEAEARDRPYLIRMGGSDEQLAPSRSRIEETIVELLSFFADRLKVQQRAAGVRHDLIDAVFALGGEDDLVRLLARVHALQAFIGTEDGANLLTGYRRAANILKKEGWDDQTKPVTPAQAGVSLHDEMPAFASMTNDGLSYTPEPEEAALIAALDAAAPAAAEAVAAEDFEGAMAALATLRAPIDTFFERVTVNDANQDKRAARLALLARIRDAVHGVADFSRIEG